MAHSETNYEPDPTSTVPIQPRRYGSMGNLTGTADPNGQINGRAGWSFYDENSGDLYFNTGDGYNSVWTLFASGGGGGGPDVKFNSFLDPNGNVTGSVDDIYKSVESLGGDGSVWFKQTGTATNTGWI